MNPDPKSCVLIAFKDRKDELSGCLDMLLPQLSERRHVLLVDDGSETDIFADANMAARLESPFVFLVRHPLNRGVSEARNTGIHWCRERDYGLVVMTDSDCLVPDDFIDAHIAQHLDHPGVVVVGGAIRGMGNTFWSTLDRIMTWFHCIPGSPARIVPPPYSAPTANISIKMEKLDFEGDFFDGALRTGEDTAFSRKVRKSGADIFFSPTPEIGHRDRQDLGAFLKHQYAFGRHHYFISHLDFGIERFCFKPIYRAFFAPAFVFLIPIYAVLGCYLNIVPWVQRFPHMALYWPFVQLVWFVKAVAYLESIVFPSRAFRFEKLRM